jgi:hypothetical protein
MTDGAANGYAENCDSFNQSLKQKNEWLKKLSAGRCKALDRLTG